MILSRDALQHNKPAVIVSTLRRWARSDAKWLLVGSYPNVTPNVALRMRGIEAGKSFDIDLRKPPYCLEPTQMYRETHELMSGRRTASSCISTRCPVSEPRSTLDLSTWSAGRMSHLRSASRTRAAPAARQISTPPVYSSCVLLPSGTSYHHAPPPAPRTPGVLASCILVPRHRVPRGLLTSNVRSVHRPQSYSRDVHCDL